jgi:hypothetical protein
MTVSSESSLSTAAMVNRPAHEVYQDNMIRNCHGFPQFSADTYENTSLNSVGGVRKIEIGDLGYFQ